MILIYLKNLSKNDKILLSALFIIGIGVFYILVTYLKNKDIWTTEPVSDTEINKRQKERGVVTSLITSFLGIIVSTIMIVFVKSDSASYQALVSIICLGIFGFLLDNAFATENGVDILFNGIDNEVSNKLLKVGEKFTEGEVSIKKVSSALKYSFGTLLSPKILRYIIVSFLDIFISLMLTDGIVWGLVNKFDINTSLSYIFAMVVVAITTFLAYSNATRLEWAYPAVEELNQRSDLISTPVILINTILAGMVFLIWKPLMKSKSGISSTSGKLMMILILFLVIVVCYYMGYLDPVLKYEIINTVIPCPNPEGVGACVNTVVVENDILSVKEIYNNHELGVLLFFILCVVLTTVVAFTPRRGTAKRFTTTNISLSIIVITLLSIPGILAYTI